MLPEVEILDTRIGRFAVFKTTDTIAQALRVSGDFEPLARTLVSGLFPEKDAVCIDVGANMGTFSVPVACANTAGKVFSFEAQRVVFSQLVTNAFLNSVENIVANNVAIGNPQGTDEKVDVPCVDFGSARNIGAVSLLEDVQKLMIAKGKYSISTTERVPLRSLDQLFSNLGQIDFIKIDVEGMELDVLQGAVEVMSRARPVIFFESWSSDTSRRKLLSNFFSEREYSLIYLGEDGLAVPSEPIRSGRKIVVKDNSLLIV